MAQTTSCFNPNYKLQFQLRITTVKHEQQQQWFCTWLEKDHLLYHTSFIVPSLPLPLWFIFSESIHVNCGRLHSLVNPLSQYTKQCLFQVDLPEPIHRTNSVLFICPCAFTLADPEVWNLLSSLEFSLAFGGWSIYLLLVAFAVLDPLLMNLNKYYKY